MLVWYVCDPEDFAIGFFFLHFNDKWYIYRVDNFHKYSLLGMCSLYIYVLKIQMLKVNEQITIRFSID